MASDIVLFAPPLLPRWSIAWPSSPIEQALSSIDTHRRAFSQRLGSVMATVNFRPPGIQKGPQQTYQAGYLDRPMGPVVSNTYGAERLS